MRHLFSLALALAFSIGVIGSAAAECYSGHKTAQADGQSIATTDTSPGQSTPSGG